MSGKTSIEWTNATWNPVRGCSRVSPGCGGANHQGGCYAEKISARFSGPGQPFEGFAERTEHGGRWTGKLALVEDALLQPLRWRKPRRIFVNSMSDLFHEALPDQAIDRVFAVMALAPWHTMQVLTKRAGRMRGYFADQRHRTNQINGAIWNLLGTPLGRRIEHGGQWRISLPLPNVWLGVSAEDQERWEERVHHLRATPAAIRFVSAEPLLGPIDCGNALDDDDHRAVNLVIVGGESGPNSRPFCADWARSIIAQCKVQGAACFVKQLGARPLDRKSPQFCHEPLRLRDRKGGDPREWPEDLRVREFPT